MAFFDVLFGLGLGLYNFFTQADVSATQNAAQAATLQEQQTALQASLLGQEASITGAKAQLAITKTSTQTQLTETQDKAAAYQTFLSKIPTAGDTLAGPGTGDTEFDRQYRALLGNLGNLNVLAGATGQVGPGTSMSLVQEQGKADVGSFVDTTKDVKQRQLNVFNTSAALLTDTLATIGATETDLTQSLADLEDLKNAPQPTIPVLNNLTTSVAAIGGVIGDVLVDWWNDPNNKLNPAHW